ncbi:MAG: hypothetical protein DRR19_12060 [Candidatus Parabeggiatoa sp. nov. 1]|nr:MAG: hypothetical protein DRR19_12060 [Gammaproteobacteria bacterium]
MIFTTPETLVQHPQIIALYQTLVDDVNKGLPSWTMIKRFKLLNSTLTIDNGMLTPTLKVRREKVNEFFAAEIRFFIWELGHISIFPLDYRCSYN